MAVLSIDCIVAGLNNGSSGFRRGSDDRPENLSKIIQLERFAQIVVHSAFQRTVTILLERTCCQSDDWQMTAAFLLLPCAYAPGCFVAIHDRHFTVHEYQIKIFLFRRVQHLLAIQTDRSPVARQPNTSSMLSVTS